jgi:DNA mismatch repair protein MutS
MVEMIETATILKNATSSSLIILDEIGRGTSTFDGLSIAWSVMEYVSNVIRAKTLFATHYHELTELEGLIENVHNYRILVHERDDEIVFLYKIARGGANKSFGIEVSRLAGVPKEVTARAKEILARLEASNVSNDTNSIMLDVLGGGKHQQISLFESEDVEKARRIVNSLKDIDVNAYTPMQALILLQDLVDSAKK